MEGSCDGGSAVTIGMHGTAYFGWLSGWTEQGWMFLGGSNFSKQTRSRPVHSSCALPAWPAVLWSRTSVTIERRAGMRTLSQEARTTTGDRQAYTARVALLVCMESPFLLSFRAAVKLQRGPLAGALHQTGMTLK